MTYKRYSNIELGLSVIVFGRDQHCLSVGRYLLTVRSSANQVFLCNWDLGRKSALKSSPFVFIGVPTKASYGRLM